MEDNSELHPESLRIQCKKAIEIIDKENEAYEELISKLQTNIVENETMSGETADSVKAYASDLICVVEYAIKANEIDKADHQALLNEVDTILADKVDVNEVLRGYDIHDEIRYTENRISEYKSYIDFYDRITNDKYGFYSIIQSDYEDQIEDLNKILQDLHNKEDRYDTIEAETKALYSVTSEIRKIAKDALVEIGGSIINGVYTPVSNPLWKEEFEKINILNIKHDSEDYTEKNKDEVYEYVHNYLLQYFSEDQIAFLYSNHRYLFNNLYATAHWSPADCATVIKTMEEALNELLEKNILNAFGWNYSDEEIKELDTLFQEFGIIDKYSIICFLVCCRFESGAVIEENNQKISVCYDKHGVSITEDYDYEEGKVDYTEKERGVGYIQVTHMYTQREAYNALIELGYITDNEGIGNDVNGYVDVLVQNPWAVSVWYWACCGVVDDCKITLNDYVVSVREEKGFHFTEGLPYVCESFVNGKITDKNNYIYHDIARDNVILDVDPVTNNILYNESDSGYKSIDRYSEFDDIYDLIDEFVE